MSVVNGSIKKAFVEVVAFLQANESKKVRDVLAEVQAMVTSKTSAGGTATTIARNADGVIVALRCGYYKQWMPLSHVEFGAKVGSASGYNPMCKEGVSNWYRQQREAAKAKEAILGQVQAGTLNAGDIQARLDEIEAERVRIIARLDGIGFDTAEEAMSADLSALDAAVQAAEVAGEPAGDDEAALM